MCLSYLVSVYLFYVFLCFGVFSLVCFVLLVPVQVIARKDSSPKCLLCVERDVKLLIHSLSDVLDSLNEQQNGFTTMSAP